MLVLSSLHNLLLQVLSLPTLHTAVLFTPEGQLVSYASDPSKTKDDIRVVVGVSGEIWQETKQRGMGMVESEVGDVIERCSKGTDCFLARQNTCTSGSAIERYRFE
jgi:hypothetical protein